MYASVDFYHYCYPNEEKLDDVDKDQFDALMSSFTVSMLGSWAIEIYNSRWVILASVGVCVGISIIYLTLMDYLASFMAWISIIVMEAGLVLIGYYLFQEQMKRKEEDPVNYEVTWLGFTSLWLLAFIYLIIIFFIYKHLNIVVDFIKFTADWLKN